MKNVRIQSTLERRINLNEVYLISGGVDVALGKAASQSSTLDSQTAGLAVDGNIITFSSTNDEIDAYWEIDLGAVFNIDTIEIRNHYCDNANAAEGSIDLCKGYLSYAIIEYTTGDGVVTRDTLGDMSGVTFFSMDLVSSPLCDNMPTSSPSNQPSVGG